MSIQQSQQLKSPATVYIDNGLAVKLEQETNNTQQAALDDEALKTLLKPAGLTVQQGEIVTDDDLQVKITTHNTTTLAGIEAEDLLPGLEMNHVELAKGFQATEFLQKFNETGSHWVAFLVLAQAIRESQKGAQDARTAMDFMSQLFQRIETKLEVEKLGKQKKASGWRMGVEASSAAMTAVSSNAFPDMSWNKSIAEGVARTSKPLGDWMNLKGYEGDVTTKQVAIQNSQTVKQGIDQSSQQYNQAVQELADMFRDMLSSIMSMSDRALQASSTISA